MSGAVTVIGLTPGSFLIEDIRVSVPYREAVQIPAHLVQRSRNLGEALHHQRVMQLGNALPVAASVPRTPTLAVPLRGRGIAPHVPVPVQQAGGASWQQERETLLRELESSRAQGDQLRGINGSLQTALSEMAGQLSQIQQTLSGMALTPGVAEAPRTRAEAPSSDPIDDSVPHFIPPTAQDVAEVRISIPETTSDSDLSGARGALRTLRSKPTV